MKKFAIFAAALAAAFATFAAFDFQSAKAIPALAPQTVSAGATNEAALVVAGLKGNGELLVADAGAAGRTSLDLTLWASFQKFCNFFKQSIFVALFVTC